MLSDIEKAFAEVLLRLAAEFHHRNPVKQYVQQRYGDRRSRSRIWQFKTTQFDGLNVGLFAKYVNTFLKIKQDTNGCASLRVGDATKAQ